MSCRPTIDLALDANVNNPDMPIRPRIQLNDTSHGSGMIEAFRIFEEYYIVHT